MRVQQRSALKGLGAVGEPSHFTEKTTERHRRHSANECHAPSPGHPLQRGQGPVRMSPLCFLTRSTADLQCGTAAQGRGGMRTKPSPGSQVTCVRCPPVSCAVLSGAAATTRVSDRGRQDISGMTHTEVSEDEAPRACSTAPREGSSQRYALRLQKSQTKTNLHLQKVVRKAK